jgi:ankyrin repeat protein
MKREPTLLAIAALLFASVVTAAPPSSVSIVDRARDGDLAGVRTLLESDQELNVDATRGDGMTALHWAAESGQLDMAHLLLKANANADATTRIGGYTPLHLASRAGHVDIVNRLLDTGVEVDARTTTSGVTPLHLAAAAIGGADAVRALLDRGANPNARESSAGQTPLMFAASRNHTEAVRVLLALGADPSIRTNEIDVLRTLALDREAEKRLRKRLSDDSGGENENDEDRNFYARPKPLPADLSPTEVQAAIRAQREFLLSGYDVGKVDGHSLARVRPDYPGGPDVVRPPYREVLVGKTGGMTALLHAVREGNIEAANALLDGDADINQVSADGTSPLLIATLNGRFDLALALLRRGADPNLAAFTDGSTPLFAVLQTQWAPKSNYPQPRAQDEERASHLEVLEALLEAGANPNVRLNTHLWYWEYGLNKMGIDLTGATPLWRAAFAQDIAAMKLLADHGADPNISTVWPEVGMRERRQQDGRQQEDSTLPYIPEGAPNAYPIHAAAGGGYLGLGAFSVRNIPDNFLAALKYLVDEHGADVNLSDSWGYRPLHYAAARGDNELIEYLVSEGADVKVITRLGQSTADMARGGRSGFFTRVAYPETVELLTSLGSTLECLHTHFLDTGDFCEGAGKNDPWGPSATVSGARRE